MLQRAIRGLLGVAVLLALGGGVAKAQDEFILPYLKTPETPQEFWAALEYEIELGNHTRAAENLKNFYERSLAIADEDLQRTLFLKLYDRKGMSYFLKLSNLPELRKVTAKDPVTQKDRPIGEILVAKVGALVEQRLGDPGRIKFFIENLTKSPEERAYAITQLRASGPRAVPFLISVLRDQGKEQSHQTILTALLKMNSDVGPPLLAAMDVPEANVRSLLVSYFLQRGDDRVVPALWHLHGTGKPGDKLTAEATAALLRFLRVPRAELGEARVALTREAERFYKGEVDFGTVEQLTVWHWDAKANELKPLAVADAQGRERNALTRVEAEEYFASYWARRALEVDPAHRPAQIIFASTTLESVYRKAAERNQLDQPLAKLDAGLQQVLAGTPPGLLEAVLERAMNEGRTGTVLAATQALTPSGDWKLIRSERGTPPLIRALSYPDRRVQLAAAEAALQVPTSDSYPGSARVVEVLKRAVSSEPHARALIVHANSEAAQKWSALARQLGYQPVVAATGRDALRQAMESADFEIIFADARVADPELPYFVAQLRAGPDTSGVPVVVLAAKEQEAAVRGLEKRFSRVKVLAPPPASLEMLKHELTPFLADRFRLPLSDAERNAAAKTAVDLLLNIAMRERSGYDLAPAEATLHKALGRDDLAGSAAAVLAYRSGRTTQSALGDAVLNETRPPGPRAEIARQLRTHLIRHGVLLRPAQLEGLVKLASTAADGALKEEAARLAVTLKADAALEGTRLRNFAPTAPKPAEGAKEQP
jgi:CheY-like chemotaxis protein